MSLSHAIAHGVNRAGIGAPVNLTLADDCLPLNGILDELVRELKHAFVAKAGKQYGQFTGDLAQAQLAGWLRDFSEERMPFSSFSHRACEHFKGLLSQAEAEFDGVLLFAIEKLADADVLFIFVMQQSQTVYLDGNLSVQTSMSLDASGIRLGAKINLTDWLTGEASYLSVLRARGEKELTDAFIDFLGFSDQRDIAAETTEFLDIVRNYTAQMPEEEAQDCRSKVVDFCLTQDKAGQSVVIEELSQQVNESSPEEFATFVSEHQEVHRPALIPDRRQLRQFVRISGRNDQLSMSFSSECLGDTIMYDKQSDSLTITHIPGPLKLRLMQHMQANLAKSSDSTD